jgi:hypothetical protein
VTDIPIVAWHRDVGLHDHQDEARLAVVRREIDEVLDRIEDPVGLYEFASDVSRAPEARLLAAAKCAAIWQGLAESGKERPKGVSLELLRAATAGLNSAEWRDRYAYDTILKTIRDDGVVAVRRKTPLDR